MQSFVVILILENIFPDNALMIFDKVFDKNVLIGLRREVVPG